jgi:hypothetical protein
MHAALEELIDKLYTVALTIDPDDSKYRNYAHVEQASIELAIEQSPEIEMKKRVDDEVTLYMVAAEDCEWIDPVLDKMMVINFVHTLNFKGCSNYV